MIETLINEIRKYNKDTDEALIRRAYEYAKKAHKGQKRKSGEDYIIHPVNVALILTELQMDDATICAALMHDVLEDTEITYDQMKEEFGEEITELVNGVTKLKNINFKSKKEGQSENIRKMILATSKDIRVVIIKLADRIHNMRTLEYMTRSSQIAKATETLEVYVPFAHRLGMNKMKSELEDLCFKFIDPVTYLETAELVNKKRSEREVYINKIMKRLSDVLDDMHINHDISGRPKSLYSIYTKMQKQGKSFDELYDLTAIRVIVDTIKDCYYVLGQVHSMWTMMNHRFKDYISVPKTNLYQSLHTTVFADDGEIIEVQIRTWEMHRIAEYGIAAHWHYKEGKQRIDNFDKKVNWIRQMMEVGTHTKDSSEFMKTLKENFFSDEVYVYSPTGDLIDLPKGANPIDFAYRIHSAVGNKCVGAKINSKIVPLTYELKSGDVVEILTSKNSQGPSRDWLKIVKTSTARQKIRQWFKKEKREENIEMGRDLLEKEVRKDGYKFSEILREDWLDEIAQRNSFSDLEDMYAAIGYGTMQTFNIVQKLKEKYQESLKEEEKKELQENDNIEEKIPEKKTSKSDTVAVLGNTDFQTRLSKCCNPVPGDEIVGFITRGRGISIHRKDCPNVVNNFDKNRMIEVSWNDAKSSVYRVKIRILGYDHKGYLNQVTELISKCGLNIDGLSGNKNKDKTYTMEITVDIESKDDISNLINQIKKLSDTIEVYRI